jgi:uncharacterized protein YbaR (Trm112 family)
LATKRAGPAPTGVFTSRGSFIMTVSPQLLAILVCPKCKKELEYREAESALLCHNCKLRYPIRDGIPIMLIEEASPI